MNDSDDPNTRSRPPAHTRGSGLRPLDVVLSEQLDKTDNDRPGTTENDVGKPTTFGQRQIHARTTTTSEVRLRDARARAVQMMRERGVDDAESLLPHAEPQAIIRTCEWFDRQPNAKKGLLVWKVRDGGVPLKDAPVSRTQTLREVFDRYVTAHPVDSRLCSHMALAARKWPGEDETCPGQLMVVAAVYPVLEMQCDGCGFEASLTPRAMKEAM